MVSINKGNPATYRVAGLLFIDGDFPAGRKYALLEATLRWGDFLVGEKVTKDPPKGGPFGIPQIDLFFPVQAQVGPGPGGADWMAGHIFGQSLLR